MVTNSKKWAGFGMQKNRTRQAFRRLSGFPPGLLILTLLIWYFASLYSYDPLDPSPLSVLIPPETVSNLGGEAGAWVSGVMLYGLGLFAFSLAVPGLAMVGYFLLLRGAWLKSFLAGWGLLTLSAMLLAQELQPQIHRYSYELPTGGAAGLLFHQMTLLYLGPWGVQLMIFLLLGGSLWLFRNARAGALLKPAHERGTK